MQSVFFINTDRVDKQAVKIFKFVQIRSFLFIEQYFDGRVFKGKTSIVFLIVSSSRSEIFTQSNWFFFKVRQISSVIFTSLLRPSALKRYAFVFTLF